MSDLAPIALRVRQRVSTLMHELGATDLGDSTWSVELEDHRQLYVSMFVETTVDDSSTRPPPSRLAEPPSPEVIANAKAAANAAYAKAVAKRRRDQSTRERRLFGGGS